jgi:hypothetical protein
MDAWPARRFAARAVMTTFSWVLFVCLSVCLSACGKVWDEQGIDVAGEGVKPETFNY